VHNAQVESNYQEGDRFAMAENGRRIGPWFVAGFAFIAALAIVGCGNKNDSLVGSAKDGRLEDVRNLLKQGADVNARTGKGATALMWACFFGRMDVVKLLLKNGADVNAKDARGWTALMTTAEQGHPAVMKLLIAKGADVNARNADNRTALTYAEGRKRDEEAAILRAAGARQ
jgi:uncharacterized protein